MDYRIIIKDSLFIFLSHKMAEKNLNLKINSSKYLDLSIIINKLHFLQHLFWKHYSKKSLSHIFFRYERYSFIFVMSKNVFKKINLKQHSLISDRKKYISWTITCWFLIHGANFQRRFSQHWLLGHKPFSFSGLDIWLSFVLHALKKIIEKTRK